MVLFGLDVSDNNGPVDWDGVRSAGEAFGIAKCTEGTGYVDEQYARNWSEMGRVGMVRGSYHFARPDLGVNPVDEARFFLNHLGPLVPGDLIVLDLEMPTNGSVSPAHLSWHGLTWLQTVEQALGFKPLLYTYPYYATNNLIDASLGVYPLWLASYDGTLPARIGVWSEVAIWQYAWTGRIQGVSGNVDVDQLARTLDGLRALGKPLPIPTPPVVPPPVPGGGDGQHYALTADEKMRAAPVLVLPTYGPLLPKGTRVVRVTAPRPLPTETTSWMFVRTSGDRRGYLLKSNLKSYTP